MQVEHRLARAGADVHEHAVVPQADFLGRLRDEFEHAPGFSRIEVPDLAEGVDVALRDHEHVHRRLRIDVVDRDEAFALVHVRAFARDAAEEAVVMLLRHGSPPR